MEWLSRKMPGIRISNWQLVVIAIFIIYIICGSIIVPHFYSEEAQVLR
jgi:hypothetical protein